MKLKIVTLGKSEFVQEMPDPGKSIDEISSALAETFALKAIFFDGIDGRHIVLPTASIDYIEVLS